MISKQNERGSIVSAESTMARVPQMPATYVCLWLKATASHSAVGLPPRFKVHTRFKFAITPSFTRTDAAMLFLQTDTPVDGSVHVTQTQKSIHSAVQVYKYVWKLHYTHMHRSKIHKLIYERVLMARIVMRSQDLMLEGGRGRCMQGKVL